MNSDFQIFAAPMAGITDQPFRKILRRLNPSVPIMTEMISCHSITSRAGRSPAGRNADLYFNDNVGAQIFGAEPKLMAEAAKILEGNGAKWIDINMGCPVPKVATRACAGAFLMKDHPLAGEIMRSVVAAVKVPVSIKTRLGWDEQHLDCDDLLRIAFESGISFAIVHARTRAQGYSGKARWELIPSARGKRPPVVFNGDIKTERDVLAVKNLGAVGAMIGRAMLGNPWLLAKRQDVRDVVGEHFDSTLSYYGSQGVLMFRKHLAWYAAGMPGAAQFRQRANRIADADEMKKAIAEFWRN